MNGQKVYETLVRSGRWPAAFEFKKKRQRELIQQGLEPKAANRQAWEEMAAKFLSADKSEAVKGPEPLMSPLVEERKLGEALRKTLRQFLDLEDRAFARGMQRDRLGSIQAEVESAVATWQNASGTVLSEHAMTTLVARLTKVVARIAKATQAPAAGPPPPISVVL